MKRLAILLAAAAGLALASFSGAAQADVPKVGERWLQRQAAVRPWHAPYYHTQYGTPVGLVVPPNVSVQTHWYWGVGGTRISPIYHQFARPYDAGGYGGPLYPTPHWPSSTDQFGVYYIRGPW